MKKDEIHLWDIKRILFGQAPPEFLLEVFIRSLIIYIAAIIILRWMGKRMNGQLTIVELSVIVMMGAIIAVPMQVPDKGILPGLLILLVTLGCLRGINLIAFKSSRFEKLMQGQVSTLVKDGVLQLNELSRNKITTQQIFGVLRKKDIYNLGKVKRVYLEACGVFSVYENAETRPGLSLYPAIDKTIYQSYPHTEPDMKACSYCGQVQNVNSTSCANCGKTEWTKAIL